MENVEDFSILGNSFISANQLDDLKVIETSIPEINEAFGCGGLPRGRAIELYASKSEGKTSLGQWFVKECQAQGLNCAWADAEGTFSKPYASGAGVNLEKLKMIEFSYGEDLLYKLELALASNLFDLIILDSINAVTPSGHKDASVEGASMYQKMEAPKMWSDFFKLLDGGYEIKSPKTEKLVPSNVVTSSIDPKTLKEVKNKNWHRLAQKKTVLIFINHRLDKIGVSFGAKHYTPGGARKDFTYSLRLNLSLHKTVLGQSQGKEVLKYKLIRMKPEKNKVGEPLKSIILRVNPDGSIQFEKYPKSKKLKDEEPEPNPHLFKNLEEKLS